jgi:hypothetical protein
MAVAGGIGPGQQQAARSDERTLHGKFVGPERREFPPCGVAAAADPRAIDALGLKLLRFGLPTPEDAAQYRELAPHDPLHRDFAAWQAYEIRNPSTFAAMYKMTLAHAS